MHDAFMNFNSGKSRLPSSRRGLERLCLNVRILRANGNSKFLPKPPMTKRIPFPHNQHSHHRMLNRLLKWRKKNSDVNTVFIVTLLNIIYYIIYCYYIQTTASIQRYRAIFYWVSEIRRDFASFPCSALWLIRKACANFSTNKIQNWTASQFGRSHFPALKYLFCLFSDFFWLSFKLFLCSDFLFWLPCFCSCDAQSKYTLD